MHYKVLFRIEKYPLMDKLLGKIYNFRKYCEETGDSAEIRVVMAGDVVRHFEQMDSELVQNLINQDLSIALCHNALSGYGMNDIQYNNISTVRAGIGEIIRCKSQGYIEYTIE